MINLLMIQLVPIFFKLTNLKFEFNMFLYGTACVL